MPGMGGAPTVGPLPELTFASTKGADRSFVTVDFNFRPLEMSPRSAPCAAKSAYAFSFTLVSK